MALTLENIQDLALKFVQLRNKADVTLAEEDIKEYEKYQNICVTALAPIVYNKAMKYKSFSNHPDLIQDGFEALVLAFKTYNPDKGNFAWWANKYVGTRIARKANTFTTIRYPLKKAREINPIKTSNMPVVIDDRTAEDSLNQCQQDQRLEKAIGFLPEDQKNILMTYFGFSESGLKIRNKTTSIKALAKEMNLPKKHCAELLVQAQNNVKNNFGEI